MPKEYSKETHTKDTKEEKITKRNKGFLLVILSWSFTLYLRTI